MVLFFLLSFSFFPPVFSVFIVGSLYPLILLVLSAFYYWMSITNAIYYSTVYSEIKVRFSYVCLLLVKLCIFLFLWINSTPVLFMTGMFSNWIAFIGHFILSQWIFLTVTLFYHLYLDKSVCISKRNSLIFKVAFEKFQFHFFLT